MPLENMGIAQVIVETDAGGLQRWSEHLATAPRDLTVYGMPGGGCGGLVSCQARRR